MLERLKNLIANGIPVSVDGKAEVIQLCSDLIRSGPEPSLRQYVRDSAGACLQRVMKYEELTSEAVSDIIELTKFYHLGLPSEQKKVDDDSAQTRDEST